MKMYVDIEEFRANLHYFNQIENHPLEDIIWIDSAKKVVSLRTNVLPESYPETFSPTKNARYVLEVPAGSAASAGVKIGDTVRFTLKESAGEES